MPITATLTITQGSDVSKCTISDSTVVGGETITTRTLTIYKSDGSVYKMPGQVTDAINFNPATYPSNSIEITGLDKDYALTVYMTLTPSVVVVGSVYTASKTVALTGYTQLAEIDRWERASEEEKLYHNDAFMVDTVKLLLERDNSNLIVATDIVKAQKALDRARRIIITNSLPY